MMTRRFVIVVFAFIWQSQLCFSSTVQIILIKQSDLFKTNNRSDYLSSEYNEDGLGFNFTVLEYGGKSHQEILDTFCSFVKNTGVSVIISEDSSTHPKLLDIYASYSNTPIIKLFHSAHEQQIIKQVC